ncbi:MAG: flippase-like domain-containing protein [Myxococcota bacterium]|nr:flippase-like domain-containing protein [Myxococcota bacterium]
MEEPRRRPSILVSFARIVIAIAGLAALAWTIQDAGAERILAILPAAAAWIPLAILLEAVRVGFDALSTRLVLAERGREIPFRALYFAQLAAQGVMGVSPAGRSASEIVKATLLSAWIRPQVAAAMGYTNQANVLISAGLFSLLCLAGILATSPDSTLAYATLIHFAVLVVSGVGMRVASTNPDVERLLARRFPRLAEKARLFHEASRDTPLIAPAPVLAMFAGRAVQTLQFAVLAHAVGIDVGVGGALAVQGVNLVAAATGVFVPSQVGTAELVFRLSAEALHTTPAIAVSLALLARVPQLTFIAIGLLVLLLWRSRRRVGTA